VWDKDTVTEEFVVCSLSLPCGTESTASKLHREERLRMAFPH